MRSTSQQQEQQEQPETREPGAPGREEQRRPVRPLPIGAFALPFGFLLIPPGEDTEPARDQMLAGRLPTSWPEAMHGHRLAWEEADPGQVLAAFDGDDPVSGYNRLVLDPDGADVDAVRAGLGELGVLVDLVLFVLGRAEHPPQPETADGEIAALILAAQATEAAERDPAGAAELLQSAIAAADPVYPALAGVLHGALATLRKQVAAEQPGGVAQAIPALEAGIARLRDTELDVALAEQQLELGAVFHELAGADRPDLLQRAVHHYHSALQSITRERAPELFAAAHANLATAYLTMPMTQASDQLRIGVALASLRAALTVYTPQTHPLRWASAQLNLANALVYAPSTHQADNLVEAVELYEAVLAARDRTSDPLGYARVLANQGNVLAHLGMFDPAQAKLADARFIFEEFKEYDAVTSVRSVIDEIARRRSAVAAQAGNGTGAL